jgi:hypothetical protein
VTEELILSASSVDNYKACEYRWYLTYMERHEGEQSVAGAVGTAVHAAAAAHYMAILEGEPISMDEALETYDMTYMLEVEGMLDPEEDPVKMRAAGRRAAITYLEDVAPPIQPRFVEHAGQAVINDIQYSYVFDVVSADNVIHETKIKGAKPRYFDQYWFQTTGQAIGFRANTGEIERDIVLDVVLRLKRDRPRHIPYSSGGSIDDDDIRRFARVLEWVATGITKGRFRPTGLEKGVCKWCPVKAICEPYQEAIR